MNEERNVVAFFYEKLDKVATKIIAGLTKVEEHFTGQDITFINIDVNDVQVCTVWKKRYFFTHFKIFRETNLMGLPSLNGRFNTVFTKF